MTAYITCSGQSKGEDSGVGDLNAAPQCVSSSCVCMPQAMRNEVS